VKSSWASEPEAGRRSALGRRWAEGPRWLWVGLNPSTAGASAEDQTTRKIRGFSERGGAGAYVLMNLFDRRATDPRDLRGADLAWLALDRNLQAVAEMARDCDLVVCCWGRHGRLHGQDEEFLRIIGRQAGKLRALRINSDGTPAHPLMLPYSARMRTYTGGSNGKAKG
jgi:hypothetical protein